MLAVILYEGTLQRGNDPDSPYGGGVARGGNTADKDSQETFQLQQLNLRLQRRVEHLQKREMELLKTMGAKSRSNRNIKGKSGRSRQSNTAAVVAANATIANVSSSSSGNSDRDRNEGKRK